MKWAGIGAGGLVALAALAVVAGPSLLPDGFVAEKVAAASRAATGRPVTIAGGSDISLLPSPRVTLRDLRFPGIEGGEADMVRVREVEVQIGWGTIFGGEVRLESVRLMAPEITLERLADGRANWNFVPAEASAASGPGGAAPALDALTIEDGRIRYRDAKSRRDHRIEGLSASLSAADLVAGPFRFEAEGRLDEAPLVLRLKTGRITPVGPTPVELEARLGALDVRAAAKIVLAPTLSVEAKVKLGVIDLGALPAGLVPSGGGQGAAGEAEPFVPPGNVAMTLDLDVEAIRAHGQTSGPARARLEMAGGRLRIPEMTVEAPGGGALSLAASLEAADGRPRAEWRLEAAPAAPRAFLAWLGLGLDGLPPDAFGKLDLAASGTANDREARADKLVLTVDDTRLEGALSFGFAGRPRLETRLTIDGVDLDRYLPSPGTAAETAEDAAPMGDLLAWLNDIDADIDLSLGEARRHGQVVRDARLKASLAAGALRVETLEVRDLAGARLNFRGDIADLASGAPRYDIDYRVEAAEAAPVIRLLDPARVPEGARLGPLVLSGTVKGDRRRVTVDAKAALAGARAELEGVVGLTARAPVDVRLVLEAEDPGPALALAGVSAPAGLGPIRATVTAKGDATAADITGEAVLAGGKLELAGEVAELGTTPRGRIDLRLDHPRPTALLTVLGIDHRPAAPDRLAPLVLTMTVRADGTGLSVPAADLKLGTTALGGEGVVKFAPLEADVKIRARRLDLDSLLAKGAARGEKDAAPASPGGLPENLALRLDLAAERIDWNGGRVTGLVARGGLEKGAIRIDELRAKLPGDAQLTFQGRQTPGASSPRLEGEVALSAGEPRKLLAWLGAPLPELPATRLATLSLDGRLAGEGRVFAVEDLVAKFDETTLRGRLSADLSGRPRLAADLSLDRLDLDSYLGPPGCGGGGEGTAIRWRGWRRSPASTRRSSPRWGSWWSVASESGTSPSMRHWRMAP